MTVAIEMGHAAGGAPATLDLEELLATRLLVQGNSGSGKSHLLRRLLEQSAPWVQQAVIDPEGDFVTLAERHGHLVIDAAARTDAGLARGAAQVREHRVSVVLNLEGLDAEGQMRAAAAFLGGLFDADRDVWYPLLVVVDEAQLFAPAVAGEVSDEARRLSLGAMTDLMCRGRKRGLAGVIATQRLAKLAKNVAAEASNFLMGRTFLDIDMARAADLLGMERRQAEAFRDLERGHFIALGPALSRRPLGVRIGPTETGSRSPGPKLVPPPPPAPEAVRESILAPPEPDPVRPPPRRAPAPPPPDILAQLAQRAAENAAHGGAQTAASDACAGRLPPAAARAAAPLDPAQLAERQRRAGEILRQILADPEAAYRPVGVLYQDFLVRCRIQEVPGAALEMAPFRKLLATARAGVPDEVAAGPAWQDVAERAAGLPEDVQGVFLLLAHTALEGQPCPSDATLARAYGTHSLGRARRLLAYLEERGLLVLRHDRTGRRQVVLTGLGWETAPGDPNAAEAA